MNSYEYNIFLKSYKTYIKYIMISKKEVSKYKILVSRTFLDEDLVKVNIIIRNSKYDYKSKFKLYEDKAKDNYFEFSSHIILDKTTSYTLINDIRNDFKDNTQVIYSLLNPRNFVQVLENDCFSLYIHLYNEEELQEAQIFNDCINQDANRYRRVKKIN